MQRKLIFYTALSRECGFPKRFTQMQTQTNPSQQQKTLQRQIESCLPPHRDEALRERTSFGQTNRNVQGLTEAEWLPPKHIERLFGVSRSTLYDWIKRDMIESASFKNRHQRHGKRLVRVSSVREYIEAHIVSGSRSDL